MEKDVFHLIKEEFKKIVPLDPEGNHHRMTTLSICYEELTHAYAVNGITLQFTR